MTLLWFLLLALAPLLVLGMAIWRRNKFWSSRTVPADAIRLSTCLVFAATVDPSLGVLAALSVGWWAIYGWKRVTAGTLWYVIPAALWIGLRASQEALAAGLALLLGMGVLQVVYAVFQRLRIVFPFSFYSPEQVHGTMGHRTGLAAYLAMLLPLGFLTDYGWALAVVYLVGLACAPSFDSAIAVTVGSLVLFPASWPVVLLGGVALWAFRAVGKDDKGRWIIRWRPARMDTLKTRRIIWRVTFRQIQRWPAWLIGYGAGQFEKTASQWLRSSKLKEVFTEAHNDWLELWYEYGLIGLAAIAFWIYRHADVMGAGDPVTASGTTLAVAMLGNFPVRVAPISAIALLLAILVMRRHLGLVL